MVVRCWNDSGKWRIEETVASLIPSLRVIIQDKKEKYGISVAAYVILLSDPLSIFAEFEEADRKKHVAHAIWGGSGIPTKLLADKVVAEAIEEYSRISLTNEAKSMKGLSLTLKAVAEKLGKVTKTDDIEARLKMAKQLPDLQDAYHKMREKAQAAEGDVILKVKGGVELSWAEKRYMDAGGAN